MRVGFRYFGARPVAGHVPTNEAVDLARAVRDRDDDSPAVGIYETAASREQREVGGQQFVVVDAFVVQVTGQGRPPRPGVPHDRSTARDSAQGTKINASPACQVVLGKLRRHGCREVFPRQSVDVICTVGRDVGEVSFTGVARAEQGAMSDPSDGAPLQRLDGVNEREVVPLADVLDDVAACVAPETLEPFGHSADRHRRGRVVVERAAPHVPVSAGMQFNTRRCDHVLDRVGGTDGLNINAFRVCRTHSSCPGVGRTADTFGSSVKKFATGGCSPSLDARANASSTAARGTSLPMTAYSSQVGSYT